MLGVGHARAFVDLLANDFLDQELWGEGGGVLNERDAREMNETTRQ